MKALLNPYAKLEGHNCFGCSPENHFGLRLKFFEDGDEVVCTWEPEERFQGWINVLHGGIQATLMDEIASWVVFVKKGTVGMTYRLTTKYRKPVYIDKGEITLRARLKETRRNISEIEVGLFDAGGKLCTEATIEYFIFPEEKARKEMFFPGREAFIGKSEDNS